MNADTIIAMDLGGTKCAAAIITHIHATGQLICEKFCNVQLTETQSLTDLIRQIEAQLHIRFRDTDAVCIGAAGQYNGHELLHLDGVYPYPMPFAAVAATEHWPQYAVIHDYDTVVCATFTSYMQDENNILRLNSCPVQPHKRRVALGLGTGLGMKDGVLMPNGDFWLGKNEVGHIGIINPPHTDSQRLTQHQEFIHFLYNNQKSKQQAITLENILTGRGLVHLQQFLYPTAGELTPEAVSIQMTNGKMPELLDLLAWYLGVFIGSIELIFMPESGIWITGGVASKNLEIFSQASFIAGIKASPAYLHERTAYPLGVLKNTQHALIGAGYYAVKRLLNRVTYLSSYPQ
jgi:glucokinase